MLTFHNIDPVAVSLGPVKVHWYGLMYVIGIGMGWSLCRLPQRRARLGLTGTQVDDLIFYTALGLLLGGRVGYMLFYNFPVLLEHPVELFRVWKGGMAFHGGLLGAMLAIWLFGRRQGKSFFQLTDFLAPWVPIGLFAGRIGNFINGELWGRPSDLPWAMVFPTGGPSPRHPSQLYEALLEGIALFLILQIYTRQPRPTMGASGLFLLCYGLFRFAAELVREPDPQLGYLAFGWLTMGQVLSLPMLVGGVILLHLAYRPRTA